MGATKMKKGIFVCVLAIFLPLAIAFSIPPANNTSADDLITQGYKAYNEGNWSSAAALYRKAVNMPGYSTDENWFMLVISEMYASEYVSAVQDAERFLVLFPNSSYVSYVRYHTGRAYFLQANHVNAVYHLTEFCNDYPKHELYPSALFWIAESFFMRENYDSAESLYARIVTGYPLNSKQNEAQARLEIIRLVKKNNDQLALLKKNSELTLAEKNEYERLSKLEVERVLLEATHAQINETTRAPVSVPVVASAKEPVLTEQQQFITTLIAINAELDKEKQQTSEYQKLVSALLAQNSSQSALQWTSAQQLLIAGLMSQGGKSDTAFEQTKREQLVAELLSRSADINNRQSRPEERQKLIVDLQNADTRLNEERNRVAGQQYLIMQLISSSMGLGEGSKQALESTQAAAINQNLSILEKQFSDVKKADEEALTSEYATLLRKARLLWAYIVEQNQY
jgi:outer membrane protein assembly factor BamD (BamD/ComL family)